jgi:tagatose 1,6-diphosphate aldolase GatY/KbaY
MIVPFAELVDKAQSSGQAVGAFTVYGLEAAVGVLSAAEQHRADVIILISAETFCARLGPALVSGTRTLGQQSPASCCLQLDHVSRLELVTAGFAAGFGCVMVDGSRLAFDKNAELVKSATDIARAYGGSVEAELGRVEGDEDCSAGADVGALTDPDEAARFMTATGAACLAVSIGNVHGHYRAAPRLDLARLGRVARDVSQPLSLHGASGIPASGLTDAIATGISKVNVNTELRQDYFAVVRENLAQLEPGAQLLRLGQLISSRIEGTVADKLDIFDRPGRGPRGKP